MTQEEISQWFDINLEIYSRNSDPASVDMMLKLLRSRKLIIERVEDNPMQYSNLSDDELLQLITTSNVVPFSQK